MRHPILLKKHEELLDTKPGFMVTGGYIYLVRVLCLILGYGLVFISLCSLMMRSGLLELMNGVIDKDSKDIESAILLIIQVLCIGIGIVVLYIARLCRMILRRNAFIEKQKEFADSLLVEIQHLEKMERETDSATGTFINK